MVVDPDGVRFASYRIECKSSADALSWNGRKIPERIATIDAQRRTAAPQHAHLLRLGRGPTPPHTFLRRFACVCGLTRFSSGSAGIGPRDDRQAGQRRAVRKIVVCRTAEKLKLKMDIKGRWLGKLVAICAHRDVVASSGFYI